VGCSITGNTALDYGGGFSCSDESEPELSGCVLSGNPSSGGGGIFINNRSNPRLTACSIDSNTAEYSGGGIYCSNGSLTAENCSISDNFTERNGGGVYGIGADAAFSACTVNRNTADFHGGGVQFASNSEFRLTNCTIAENSTEKNGGGVRITGTVANLVCCTIAENAAAGVGGGVSGEYSQISILNCISWGNGDDELDFSTCDTTVTYCDVAGGWPGEGNIDEDPRFTGVGNYHILESSPCMNSGTSVGAPSLDIDGDPRPWGPEVDIGSDEVRYEVIDSRDSGRASSSGSGLLPPPRPNPCNPVVIFPYTVSKGYTARLTIYDQTGKLLAVLADGVRGPGNHSAAWEPRDRPSGVYICRLQLTPGGEILTRRFVIVK